MGPRTTYQAARILEQLRNVPPGNKTACRLDGDMVMVAPMDGGLFSVLSIPGDEPQKSRSYGHLKSIGTDISIQRADGGMYQYAAAVTADDMLRRLIRPWSISPA